MYRTEFENSPNNRTKLDERLKNCTKILANLRASPALYIIHIHTHQMLSFKDIEAQNTCTCVQQVSYRNARKSAVHYVQAPDTCTHTHTYVHVNMCTKPRGEKTTNESALPVKISHPPLPQKTAKYPRPTPYDPC